MANEPTLRTAFEEICGDVKQFQGAVSQLAAKTKDADRRERVEALLQGLQKAFADVEEAMPKAIASIEERHAAQMEHLRQCQAQAATLRQKLEEAKKAKAPAAVPAAAIDPEHGARLRREVLEHFAEHAPAVPQGGGDVADMTSAAWAKESAARPAPARQRDQDAKKPVGRSDVADLSSGAWDKDEPE